MTITYAYKFTGLIVLVLGLLFFLRDMGLNLIGNTSGWTIVIVLLGSAILAGMPHVQKPAKKKV
ncbi:hypothetical protein ISS05_05235 [Candidatus Woesearchaeota archaeon]|nr:hypothetical protein [Candidatus Woesearchaeota archaeon]